MKAILLLFHCQSNAGYAINALLPTFYKMAKKLVTEENIHISFTQLNGTTGNCSLEHFQHLIAFNPRTTDKSELKNIEKYIRQHKIDVVFGFDQPLQQTSYKYLRRGGIKTLISYWGAPMSSVNTGIKLKIRQLQVMFTANKPDHYIFESVEMARSAYLGRGIQKKDVSMVYLGVDTNKFKPASPNTDYAYNKFNIPRDQKIIYYSGHMEQRKGVAILMAAARYLYESLNRRDFHFLILGNKNDEAKSFIHNLADSDASMHVTFAGYRTDVENIIPSCYLGTIASTGWDSFTVSSLEIASCGLPLIVSNLQGLKETVQHNETGLLFEPGDHQALSQHICHLIDNPKIRQNMSNNARQRIQSQFSLQHQIDCLTETVKTIASL